MTDVNKVWPETNETAKARIEQAEQIKSTVANAGLRFDVYLPPDLATWVLEQVAYGHFVDPSEAVFVHMQQARDLDSHEDLKAMLLERKLVSAMEGKTIPLEESFTHIFDEVEKKSHIQPARWQKIKQPE